MIEGFDFGFGCGLSYSTFTAQLGTNSSESIIDTLDKHATDKNGEDYMRIAIGSGLKENISIDYFSSSLNVSLKKSFNLQKLKSYISFNPGIKFSQITNSTYTATAGIISWCGYYPLYDENNFMFGEDYDFYKNDPVNETKQVLALKKSFLSAFASIDFGINGLKNENWFFYLGFYGEMSSNLVDKDHKDKMFPYYVGNYNSLLYRSEKLNINSFGLKYGITYSF